MSIFFSLRDIFLGGTLHTSVDHTISIFHVVMHKLSLKCWVSSAK